MTITREYALAEIRRYAEQYPDAPPEVVAFGLVRQAGCIDEVQAVTAAVDEILAGPDPVAEERAVGNAAAAAWDGPREQAGEGVPWRQLDDWS